MPFEQDKFYSLFDITAGTVFADNWITPVLEFAPRSETPPGMLEIKLWNPEFSTRFLKNIITVSCGGKTESVRGVKLGQLVILRVSLDSEDLAKTIAIEVAGYLPATTADQRDRALIVHGFEWTEK